MIKVPELEKFKTITINNSLIELYQPQIAAGMAVIPIITEEVVYTPEIVDESMLNAELMVLDDAGSFSRLSVQNKGEKSVLVPAATHFTGGNQNRGIDKAKLLGARSPKIVVDCHCFEPHRSSGSNRFNGISETPIDVVFQTMTTKGTNASWGAIETYTRIINRTGDSLKRFVEETGIERMHLALNYETILGQTGVVCVIGNEIVVLEVYPSAAVFEKNREKIYSGQFASMLWRMIKQKQSALLTPRDAQINLSNFLERFGKAFEESRPIVEQAGEFKLFSRKERDFLFDLVLNQNDEVAYAFAMKKV